MKNALGIWLKLAAQSVRRTFTLSGRAARRELIAWFVLVVSVNIVTNMIGALTGSSDRLEWVRFTITILAILPGFALFARRMHDIGYRGWWSLPMLLVAIQNLVLEMVTRTAGWGARGNIEAVTRYLDWVLFPAFGFVYLILLLAPGTKGTNGYGPDPRAAPDLPIAAGAA
ncbi:DUF805 domain-containing protein [Novosphingobium sp. BL-8H]|uniref:DUF805 domain-containing protein n=1 Tax=Novosphingobium sp. BL-8H TaxID=3127640 RepID=UPI0037569902